MLSLLGLSLLGVSSAILGLRTSTGGGRDASPLDSLKSDEPGEVLDDSSQDLIDKMRDMEQSGRIDMGAYRGEPNLDDEDETYGEGHDPDED